MIGRNFGEVIRQEYDRLKNGGHNIVLVRYNNEFSIAALQEEASRIGSEDGPEVLFHEFDYRAIQEPLEPFLSVIRTLLEETGTDIDGFLDAAAVYPLHREMIRSYLTTGHAERKEPVIRTEAAYERERTIEEVVSMLRSISEKRPFLLVMNRAEIAGHGTMRILEALLRHADPGRFSVILAISDSVSFPQYTAHRWEVFSEAMDDNGTMISIGSSDRPSTMTENIPSFRGLGTEHFERLRALILFNDRYTARFYLEQLLTVLEEDSGSIPAEKKGEALRLAFQNAILSHDLSRAIEILNHVRKLWMQDPDSIEAYLYLLDECELYTYQGRLSDAMDIADACLLDPAIDEYWHFRFLLEQAKIRMGAWNHVFFLREEIPVPEELKSGLLARGYLNHLAYIETYAFDNDPKVLEHAVEQESAHFQYALSIIHKTDNHHLLDLAYEKKIMMASTYGLNHIALFYFHKGTKALKGYNDVYGAHASNGIGYNLSALGHYAEAENAYQTALYRFCRLRSLEDVAEVYYNMAMNRIAMDAFYDAEDALNMCLKIIRHLRLNRIRVCNISKLYGLLALCTVLQGNLFTADQFRKRCGAFMSFYDMREKNGIDAAHDYANYDDEILIFRLGEAIACDRKGEDEKAAENYRIAGALLATAGGNCYFCKKPYYENRLSFLMRTCPDSEEQKAFDREYRAYLKETAERCAIDVSAWSRPIEVPGEEPGHITREDVDNLILQGEYRMQGKSLRRNMDFLQKWQRMLNQESMNAPELLDTAIRRFEGNFSVDSCLYINFGPKNRLNVLYNNTGVQVSTELLSEMKRAIRLNQHGLVLSKVSNDYADYSKLLSWFGGDSVCSLVLIPYFTGTRLEYIFLTCIRMRDSWFSMVNHYLLDEEDRSFYEVLFREVNFAMKRIDSAVKIREMNRMLYQSAVTDQLTGVRNRNGLYRFIDEILAGSREDFRGSCAVMFIDLDNFKPYNDTYGHEAGDIVLQGMARIFTKAVGNWGIVSRYGGDEFIILVHTDEKAILSDIADEIYEEIGAAEGFRKELRALPGIEIPEDAELSISCSIGIASTRHNVSGADIQELINSADRVLYEVKNEAKGTYRFLL